MLPGWDTAMSPNPNWYPVAGFVGRVAKRVQVFPPSVE